MCGTQGRNGGGWAHYVGQEKVRPIMGWGSFTFALDWARPPRQMISTGWYYMTTDQWRYDGPGLGHGEPDQVLAPGRQAAGRHPRRVGSARLDALLPDVLQGLDPAGPRGRRGGMAPAEYVSQELREGRLQFAIEDPDAHHNVPKILANWRTNLLGSSAKGTEFFLRHMLGTGNEVNAEGAGRGQPSRVRQLARGSPRQARPHVGRGLP